MKKQTILTLAKKEFWSFLNSPLSYVTIVPFLLISTFIYFRTTVGSGEATLRPYFELLPWFLLFLAPALSMKLLTDETRSKTIELLFAHPISELEIALGKFLGAFAFFLIILGTTLPLPISLFMFSNPDPGVIFTQYLGAALLGATFLSLGMLTSSYIKNPIGSFLLAASISFVLIILGFEFITGVLPFPVSRIVAELGVFTHMNNIARGFLDIRDVLYFVTLTALFIAITVLKLSERKIEEKPAQKRKLQLALGIIIGIGFVLNVLMSFYPLRVDLTQQRLFTLSQGTKQTLNTLPDRVTVTVYASRSLPAPMQLTLKEVNDLLSDFKKYGGKLTVKNVYPDADATAAQEAQQVGIRQVAFNTVGSGKFEVQQGFLGVSLRYADKTETIPFIQDTSDLEYQLVRRIRKLTGDKNKTIGIYQSGFGQNQFLDEVIKTQYESETLTIDDLQDKEKLKNITTLVVMDNSPQESTASALIKSYLDGGGKLLLLSDGVIINQQALSASKSGSNLTDFLSDWGITLNKDLVYDPELNETLSFSGGGRRISVPYPFWLKALPEDTSFPAIAGLKTLTFGWPSSLEIKQQQNVNYRKLWTTSENGGKLTDNFPISPVQLDTLPQPQRQKVLLAISAEKGDSRLVVVGDSDFASDEFVQQFPENAAFVANSIDYLAADKDLANIPKKVASRAVFKFTSPMQPLVFQYGNIGIPPLLVAAFGIYWLARRKKRALRKYEG